jgi:hypothetical protein
MTSPTLPTLLEKHTHDFETAFYEEDDKRTRK